LKRRQGDYRRKPGCGRWRKGVHEMERRNIEMETSLDLGFSTRMIKSWRFRIEKGWKEI
jgi:hypothetical protein